VVARPAGDDHDAPHVGQDLLVQRAGLVEVDAVLADRAVGDRLGDGVGLLVDLLEHEGLEAALLGGLLVPVDARDLALELVAGRRQEPRPLGRRDHDLAVLDVLDVARLAQERRDRRGQERLAVSAPDDQRALLARPHEHIGLLERHGHEGEVAFQLRVGRPDRRPRATPWPGDEPRDAR
jgi:hypothetical protein